MKRTISLMTLAALLTVTSAMAEHGGPHPGKDPTAAPGVEKRVERQKAKIQKRLSKGKITQDQANQLNQQVDAVQAKKEELAKDGKLSKEDRTSLREDLNKSKEAIKTTGEQKPKKEEASKTQ